MFESLTYFITTPLPTPWTLQLLLVSPWIMYPFLVVWGALGWRLRGGAFAGLTGINIGTQWTRCVFSLWMILPLALVDLRLFLLMPALWVALMTTGWGGYMAVYHDGPNTDPRLGFDWVLRHLHLPPQSLWWNLIGLGLNGLWMLAFPAGILAALMGWDHAGKAEILGLWLPFAYYLAVTAKLPLLGKFVDDETVWGEVFVGAILTSGLWCASFNQ